MKPQRRPSVSIMDTILEVGKVPPHAPDIEQAILGAIMLKDEQGMAEVSDLLKPEMFYVHAHQLIYGNMCRMYEASKPIDLLTIHEELKRSGELDMVGGPLYLTELQGKVSASAHLQYHAMLVVQTFIERETIRLNMEAMQKAYDGDEDVFDAVQAQITALEGAIAGSVRNRSRRYGEHEGDQIDRANSPRPKMHRTGFRELDAIVGGYSPGDLVIVAARPAMGKSSFAFSSAMESAERGHHTGFISLELNDEKGQARIFSRRSGIPLASILRDREQDHLTKRMNDMEAASKVPLWMRYDSAMSVPDIKAEATRLVRQHQVSTLFIDQLNWVTPAKGGNRDAEVGSITRGLKQVAMQLNICIVLLHQLSRAVETRSGSKVPQLSDLRDSGNVEQDAQVVMFLYRPEYYGITEDDKGSTIGIVDVIVAKNSNGPTGTARLNFDGPTASVHEDPAPYNPMQGFKAAPHPDSFTDPNAAPF